MERALSDPVPWMAVLFFGCAYLTVAAIYGVVVVFPTSFLVRARAFAAGMLSPLGTLFALLVVFTAAQVWDDYDRVLRAVPQEAGAFRKTLILATAFPKEPRSRLETLIHNHIEEVATKEWPMMARQSATLQHGDKRAAALVAMVLFATGAAACYLLIGAYDRPFAGQLSIRPDPLLDVMPEASSDLKQ
jgi:hypothetical protein